MLKRIATIKGIGSYTNCSAGVAEFRKTSLVFGHNSYGKTTLCEIFRSLETGQLSDVLARATIPGPVPRKVVFNFAAEGESEKAMTLGEQDWSPKNPHPFKVQVFDSAFISAKHRPA